MSSNCATIIGDPETSGNVWCWLKYMYKPRSFSTNFLWLGLSFAWSMILCVLSLTSNFFSISSSIKSQSLTRFNFRTFSFVAGNGGTWGNFWATWTPCRAFFFFCCQFPNPFATGFGGFGAFGSRLRDRRLPPLPNAAPYQDCKLDIIPH